MKDSTCPSLVVHTTPHLASLNDIWHILASRLPVSLSFDFIVYTSRFRISWQWIYDFHWPYSKGNLSLPLCLIRNLSMTLGLEVYLHTFLTSTLYSVEWSVLSVWPRKRPSTCAGQIRGPTAGLDILEKGKFSLPCLETKNDFPVVQPVALVFLGCTANRSISVA